ncbi:sensor histidine kinase [Horticoccus luteus]|uniref:histidine kinase n=1 Tax=Horticoccus luteus TaxID=2862869 RepID=A0A8F9XJ55_9BACT|nr:ATP-binding protein [Horticoccus luteus]QYM78308.1 sensor histidine kinase [Horticoccus luteus]
MSSAARRILLYWLLLLVPALGVGGAAVFLLRREQARVAERGSQAEAARRAAIAARTRLIAENAELLIGDVQTGLLDTLAAEPAGNLDAFMAQWEQGNPLVRTAFRATAGGRILRPDGRADDEAARGFLRRFNREFGGHAPWVQTPGAKALAAAKDAAEKEFADQRARRQVAANVAQVQSARRDAQALAKSTSNYPASSRAMKSEGTAERRREGEETARAGDSYAAATPAASAPAVPETVPDRRDWVAWKDDEGRGHVLGWVQPGGAGEVRGVELEMAALISRLGGVLPAEPEQGEGYALLDPRGRVMHQAGAIPGRMSEPAARLPLAPASLPGWEVAAFFSPVGGGGSGGGGFFGLGVLLVALFVCAILVGGGLLAAQARRSDGEAAQKTSFVANVSHEFKTPLTTIRLYAELLEQGRVRDAAQAGGYLQTISRETQRLARLVNNALDFSRLEQGKKKYAREEIDLTAELTRLLDTHAPRLAEGGLTVQRVLPATPVRVMADRDAVEQIVLNLLDNALKYAAGGGEVSVMLRPLAGRTDVRVADRGPGVRAGHTERIFEKFHRVDEALTAERSGAGLGLSIARQLARGLGGELRYEARAGGGAEFVFELPAAENGKDDDHES